MNSGARSAENGPTTIRYDHWQRTGIVDVGISEMMYDAWKVWLDWHRAGWPDNKAEIETLEADRGDAKLEEYYWPGTLRSSPGEYEKKPLLRNRGRSCGRVNATEQITIKEAASRDLCGNPVGKHRVNTC